MKSFRQQVLLFVLTIGSSSLHATEGNPKQQFIKKVAESMRAASAAAAESNNESSKQISYLRSLLLSEMKIIDELNNIQTNITGTDFSFENIHSGYAREITQRIKQTQVNVDEIVQKIAELSESQRNSIAAVQQHMQKLRTNAKDYDPNSTRNNDPNKESERQYGLTQ